MIIYPAIDIQNGKCVRLKRGDFSEVTEFNSDILSQAQIFEKAGFKWLHMVDLDGARKGVPVNDDLVKKVASNTNLKIQVGGGIRNLETAEKYLEAGASYIIIGTKAVEDPNFIKQLCIKFPNKIIVGIDARNGEVATEGWKSITSKSAMAFAKEFENYGVSEIVYTDIEKDGMMQGLNVESTINLAKSINIPVIASGGVSCIEDIQEISKHKRSGISGIIIGRALYEKKFSILDAKQIFSKKKI